MMVWKCGHTQQRPAQKPACEHRRHTAIGMSLCCNDAASHSQSSFSSSLPPCTVQSATGTALSSVPSNLLPHAHDPTSPTRRHSYPRVRRACPPSKLPPTQNTPRAHLSLAPPSTDLDLTYSTYGLSPPRVWWSCSLQPSLDPPTPLASKRDLFPSHLSAKCSAAQRCPRLAVTHSQVTTYAQPTEFRHARRAARAQ